MAATTSKISFLKNSLDSAVPNGNLQLSPYIEYGTSNQGTANYPSNSFSFSYPLIFGARLGATGYVSSPYVYGAACPSMMMGFKMDSAEYIDPFISYVTNEGASIFGVPMVKIQTIGYFNPCFNTRDYSNIVSLNGMFAGGSKIEEVTQVIFPNKLTTIKPNTFKFAAKLKTVFFTSDPPSDSSLIPSNAFLNITNITFVVPDDKISQWKTYLTGIGVSNSKIQNVSKYCGN